MRGRINQMRCLYIVILVDLIIPGADATTCTDKASLDGFTNVLPMCRSGTLTARRVVVDTYDTGVDHDSCQCTVSLTGTNTGPVDFEIEEYPGTAPMFGCGSVLRFTRHPTNVYTDYQCTPIISDGVTNFANNELLYITVSRVNNNIQWQSGHCIFLTSGVNITVTCDSPDTLLVSSTSEATTTAATTASSTTTTATAVSSSTTTPSTSMTTITADVKPGWCKCDQPIVPLVGVVFPVVAILLVVVMATVTNVILYKRRLTLVNELKSGKHGMTLQDTTHYDSLDQSRVEPPNTYEEMSARQTYVNTAMRI